MKKNISFPLSYGGTFLCSFLHSFLFNVLISGILATLLGGTTPSFGMNTEDQELLQASSLLTKPKKYFDSKGNPSAEGIKALKKVVHCGDPYLPVNDSELTFTIKTTFSKRFVSHKKNISQVKQDFSKEEDDKINAILCAYATGTEIASIKKKLQNGKLDLTTRLNLQKDLEQITPTLKQLPQEVKENQFKQEENKSLHPALSKTPIQNRKVISPPVKSVAASKEEAITAPDLPSKKNKEEKSTLKPTESPSSSPIQPIKKEEVKPSNNPTTTSPSQTSSVNEYKKSVDAWIKSQKFIHKPTLQFEEINRNQMRNDISIIIKVSLVFSNKNDQKKPLPYAIATGTHKEVKHAKKEAKENALKELVDRLTGNLSQRKKENKEKQQKNKEKPIQKSLPHTPAVLIASQEPSLTYEWGGAELPIILSSSSKKKKNKKKREKENPTEQNVVLSPQPPSKTALIPVASTESKPPLKYRSKENLSLLLQNKENKDEEDKPTNDIPLMLQKNNNENKNPPTERDNKGKKSNIISRAQENIMRGTNAFSNAISFLQPSNFSTPSTVSTNLPPILATWRKLESNEPPLCPGEIFQETPSQQNVLVPLTRCIYNLPTWQTPFFNSPLKHMVNPLYPVNNPLNSSQNLSMQQETQRFLQQNQKLLQKNAYLKEKLAKEQRQLGDQTAFFREAIPGRKRSISAPPRISSSPKVIPVRKHSISGLSSPGNELQK